MLNRTARWPRIGLPLLFITAISVGAWTWTHWVVVRDRMAFQEFLTSYGQGGRVIEQTDQARSASAIPRVRRWLGDRATSEVVLPYGVNKSFRVAAESRFPEATISFAPGEPLVEELFGGQDGRDTVIDPDRVEAYRLSSRERPKSPNATVDDYPAIGGPVEVPPEIAVRLAATLLSPASYHWRVANLCIPSYGVRLSFFRGNHRVDVLVCFGCGNLLVFYDDRKPEYALFSYSHNELAKAIKQLFPADEEIQSIPEQPDPARP